MKRRCAYCGDVVGPKDKEHVIPKCLYPPSRATSRIQRITVYTCKACNNGFSDDEAHFKSMMLIAGEPNDVVRELWHGSTARGFKQVDAKRRITDLFEQMKPIQTPSGERHMVFPASDERVMRIVRKVIRGLSHFHGISSPVADSRVWADVLRYVVPQEFLEEMPINHREADIVEYRYMVINSAGIESAWLLTFYERTTFIGLVWPLGSGLPTIDQV